MYRDPPGFQWPRLESGPLETHNRFVEPFQVYYDETTEFTIEDWDGAKAIMAGLKAGRGG